MVGLLRGFLGGVIAAATMAGGLRRLGRGERLSTEWLAEHLLHGADWLLSHSLMARLPLAGLKGGEKRAEPPTCPPKGAMHPLAKCPACGRRGWEHEPA